MSPSASPSLSPSKSPSPSPGWTDYTRGSYVTLPNDDTDLDIAYTGQDLSDVEFNDNIRVGQESPYFSIHQFKNYISPNTVSLLCDGQSNVSCSVSIVYLQIYNRDSLIWETIDYDDQTDADTNFSLTATILDLTNYKDDRGVISCRVYQELL